MGQGPKQLWTLSVLLREVVSRDLQRELNVLGRESRPVIRDSETLRQVAPAPGQSYCDTGGAVGSKTLKALPLGCTRSILISPLNELTMR